MFTIYRACQAGLLLAVVFFFCVVSASRAAAGSDNSNKYLFISAGDQARTAPDFLAVINFDQQSSDYGQVIATVPFAAPDAGNEAELTPLGGCRESYKGNLSREIRMIIFAFFQRHSLPREFS